LQPSGKNQYFLHIIRGENFYNRFKIYNELSYQSVRAFNITHRNSFIGSELQKSILISSQNITEAILKDDKITKTVGNIEKTLVLTEEEIQIIKNMSHEELGKLAQENMYTQDLFDSQRRFYDKVVKPQYKEDYYDL
jgi:hypothetical protein